MKNILKTICYTLFLALFITSCDRDNIDPITNVAPGADESSPVVTINKPIADFKIKVPDPIASVAIDFSVTDDIEISTVTVYIDGVQIASYNDFIDYRNFIKNDLIYDNVTTGKHTLTVTATDTEGKTTSTNVNFEKTPPYVPLYDGEIFYMPFDGDYNDLISLQAATEVGSPGLGNGKSGQAYLGATDSYLTFPTDGLLSTNEFSVSFWYKLGVDNSNAGIITIGPGPETNNTNGVKIFRAKKGDNFEMRLLVGSGSATTRNYSNIIPSNTEWVFVTATVSSTACSVYFNGMLSNTVALPSPVDWGEEPRLTIASGEPSFSGYGFKSELNYIDELRFFNKGLSKTEIDAMVAKSSKTFYMSFDGSYSDDITTENATETGTPGFTTGKIGQAYAGAEGAYLSFPTASLNLGTEFSVSFWYNLNVNPDRAGILVISDDEDRNQGFRLFRQGSTDAPTINVNYGIGTSEIWNNSIPMDTTKEWIYVTFTISETESNFYLDGELKKTKTHDSPVDWTNCTEMIIGAGGSNFSYWNHLSDLSAIDELYIFNKALTQEQVQALMN